MGEAFVAWSMRMRAAGLGRSLARVVVGPGSAAGATELGVADAREGHRVEARGRAVAEIRRKREVYRGSARSEDDDRAEREGLE
jgi:hypothetical protein